MAESRSDDYLSDADASIVLDRASELAVGLDGQVGVAELRSIAHEAGIPTEVFDQALSEVRSGRMAPSQRESGALPLGKSLSLPGPLRRLAIASLGGGFAVLAYGLPIVFGIDLDVTLPFSMILAGMSAVGLLTFRYPTREILEFEFDLASMWVGLTLLWMIFDPAHAGEVLVLTGIFGGLLGGLGAILIGRADPDRRPVLLSDHADDARLEEKGAQGPA